MLQQQNRLRLMKDFEILYKEGKFLPGKFFNLKYWKIQPDKYPRRKYSTEDLKIGFVVSTKISKLAVKRNRVKRQMREVIRLLLKDEKIKRGYMVAFLAKASVLEKEYKEIETEIVVLLKRAEIFDK
jgi:ribonuclease P protein component